MTAEIECGGGSTSSYSYGTVSSYISMVNYRYQIRRYAKYHLTRHIRSKIRTAGWGDAVYIVVSLLPRARCGEDIQQSNGDGRGQSLGWAGSKVHT